MVRILEIGQVGELAAFRQPWSDLLRQTPGASFFQSLEWLETYWRRFGAGQRLRVLVVLRAERPIGIVPLAVRTEWSKVGPIRVLTFPLHDWGAFYGPIGPDGGDTLAAALEHIGRTPRDWDVLELRWQGAPGGDPLEARRAMIASGFQAYPTVWERTAIVDLRGTWDDYWSARKGAWLRRFRHDERRLCQKGELRYVRYRPAGAAQGDGSPRWDLYDACEELARQSWQGAAADGTTLSHESVQGYLRELHETAAAVGAADINLLLLDGAPVAFIYGYHYQGYVYGLRRGYDARRTPQGAGNVLLAYTLRDSFQRGDRIYDMGPGSLESKRHFQTRLVPVWRYSHFPPLAVRAQLLRLRRWWQSRRLAASIAVGSTQHGAADPR